MHPNELIALKVSSCFGGESRRGRYDSCSIVVAPSSDGRESDDELLASVAARPSKTGAFDDTVVLDDLMIDPCIRSVYLSTLRAARKGNCETLLSDLDYKSYAKLVSAAVVQLKLRVEVTPHMFRHGAASEDFFRRLRDVAAIQHRGRWRCAASVLRYQKSCRLLSVLRKVGDSVISDAKAADQERLRFLIL